MVHELPPVLAAFRHMLATRYPADACACILDGLASLREPSFRANLPAGADLDRELAEAGIPYRHHPLSPWSYVTDAEGERRLWRGLALREGRLYMQSLPSQAAALILEPRPGDRVLDACAAPGGKTSLIAMLLGGQGTVLALERSRVRYDRLRHNLRLLGWRGVDCRCTDARSLPSELRRLRFDRILIDPPCSGSGTIRLDDPRTYAHLADRYDSYVAIKVQQQIGICRAVIPLLKPGGTLVYATCSVDPAEGEDLAASILAEHPRLRLEDVTAWGRHFSQTGPSLNRYLRILPAADAEGFFVARLRAEG